MRKHRVLSRRALAVRSDGRGKAGSSIDRGFTLVELVVVLTFIGLIAMICFVSFSEWIDTYRLSRDANAVASEMAMARFRAVSARQDISFTISGGTGYVATYRFAPGGQLKHLTYSVTISSISGDNPIVFNSRGMASGDTTVTLVNDSGTTFTVNVNIVGLVEVTEGI